MTRILETIRSMVDREGASPESPAGEPAAAGGLVSERAREAVEGQVRSLVEASRRHPPAPPGRAEVIEAMVMEHLEPVLRSWLDEHLPGIVERIVEREVREMMRRAGATET